LGGDILNGVLDGEILARVSRDVSLRQLQKAGRSDVRKVHCVTLYAMSTFCQAVGTFDVLIFANPLCFREPHHAKEVLDAAGSVLRDAVHGRSCFVAIGI